MESMDYVPGSLESSKFEHLREPYYEGLEKIKKLGYSFEDLIHYFPSFCGHLTLARYLCLIECYQRTLGVAGHMAEIGVYKAAGSMLFAKLSQIYEPNSLVQVHGFDWFRGAANLSREDRKTSSREPTMSRRTDWRLWWKLRDWAIS